MSELRQRMVEDMKLRGLAPRTQAAYLGAVGQLARHVGRGPERIEEEGLRDFFLYLLEQRKLSASSVRQYQAGIKFFYDHTLQQPMSILDRVRPSVAKTLPVVLSEDEVRQILYRIKNPVYRTVLTLIYACGLRLGEGLRVEIGDIDGPRGRLHVRHAKGNKDRFALLPERMYLLLRKYWVENRPPRPFLFPAKKKNGPTCFSTVQRAFRSAWNDSGIAKKATVHTLRHSYATHLLERGVNIRIIQQCLGHQSVRTTERYSHVTVNAEVAALNVVNKLMSDL